MGGELWEFGSKEHERCSAVIGASDERALDKGELTSVFRAGQNKRNSGGVQVAVLQSMILVLFALLTIAPAFLLRGAGGERGRRLGSM